MSDSKTEDLFDLKALALNTSLSAQAATKKRLTAVPVRRPDKQWFIRVHPSAEWQLKTALLELKDERETYLVQPQVRGQIPQEIAHKLLLTAINRQGVVFLWPIRLPDADGKIDDWNRSALLCAEIAMTRWVRVISNGSLGAYECLEVADQAALGPAEWPSTNFKALLQAGFKDRVVDSMEHPVLKRLRGEL